MRNVIKAMRLDFYAQRAIYKRVLALAYAVVIVLAFVARTRYFSVFIAMVFSSALSGYVFLVGEKNNLDRLYGILPLSKPELVLGRYLYTLLFGVANALAASLLTYVISAVTGNPLDFLELAVYLSVSFLYFCLFTGIAYPVYFRFGISRNYMLTNLPLYVVFVAAYGFVRMGRPSGMSAVIRYFAARPGMIWLTGVGGGLALWAVSWCCSRLIYQRREL